MYHAGMPEKPDKQMEIFYGTERFTSEFDGLLKPSHVGNTWDFWNVLPIFPDKRECTLHISAAHAGEKDGNFPVGHVVESPIL